MRQSKEHLSYCSSGVSSLKYCRKSEVVSISVSGTFLGFVFFGVFFF